MLVLDQEQDMYVIAVRKVLGKKQHSEPECLKPILRIAADGTLAAHSHIRSLGLTGVVRACRAPLKASAWKPSLAATPTLLGTKEGLEHGSEQRSIMPFPHPAAVCGDECVLALHLPLFPTAAASAAASPSMLSIV